MKRLLKIVGITFLILLLAFVIIVNTPIAREYAQKTMGQAIVDLIERVAPENAITEYGEVSFSLLKSEMYIADMRMDYSAVEQKSNTKIKDVALKQLDIKVNGLWKVFFEKTLEISGIGLRKPVVNLSKIKKEGESNSFTVETGDLYQYISNSLRELAITNFELSRGQIAIEYLYPNGTNTLLINDISLGIKDLVINEKTAEDDKRIFGTEEIWLNLKNQNIEFADSIHTLSFDSLSLSTARNNFEIFGFSLNSDVDSTLVRSAVDLQVPHVYIKDIDYNLAYHKRHVKMDSVHFKSGVVDLKLYGKEASEEEAKSILLSQVHKAFSPIEIGQIDVSGLKFRVKAPTAKRSMLVERIDLSLKKVFIDSSFHEVNWKTRWFEDFDFRIKDYTLALTDANHDVHVGSFFISTDKNIVQVDSITVKPILQNPKYSSLNTIQIDKFLLKGIDPFMVMRERKLAIRLMDFEGVVLAHEPKTKKRTRAKKRIIDLENLFPLVKPFLRSVTADSVRFAKLNMDFRTKNGLIQLRDTDVLLKSFILDSLSKRRKSHFLNTKGIQLQVATISLPLKDHILSVDSLVFDRNKKLISTGRIKVDSLSFVGGSKLVGEVKSTYLRGANLKELLYERQFVFDSLVIKRPKFSYVKSSGVKSSNQNKVAISDQIKSLQVGLIRLENAQWVNFVKGVPNLGVQNLSFLMTDAALDPVHLSRDKIMTKFSDLEIGFDSLLYKMEEQNHRINVGKSKISITDSSGVFKHFVVAPLSSSKSNTLLNCSIPEVRFSGLDAHHSYFSKRLDLDLIELVSPNLNFELKSKNTKNRNKLKRPTGALLSEVLDSVKIKKFKILDGLAKVRFPNNEELDLPHFDVAFTGINLNSNSRMGAGNFLFSEDIQVEMNNPVFRSGQNSIKVRDFNFSTRKKELGLGEVNLNWKNDSLKCDFTHLKITGVDLDGILFSQKVRFDQVRLYDPNFLVVQGKKKIKSNNKRFAQLDLYPFQTSVAKYVQVQDFEIRNARFKMRDTEGGINLTGIGVKLLNLHLSPGSIQNSSRPFHADFYKLSLKNFREDKDKFNTFAFKEARYNSRSKRMEIEGLTVSPKFGKRQYGEEFGKQTDRIALENDLLQLKGFDLERLVEDQYLRANKVRIDGINVDLFRDKNIPFPPEQRRQLPQSVLASLKMKIAIDTLELNQAYVTYEELQFQKEKEGVISFQEMRGSLLNVTNDPKVIQKNPFTRVTAHTKLYNSGTLTANFEFKLNDPKDEFKFNAQLSNLDLTKLNEMMEPSASVKISSGRANTMTLKGEANDEFAQGTMLFEYSKLKVSILNEHKKRSKKGAGKAITSFFANTFVVRSNNKSPLLREGEMFFIRDRSRSIFNYLSKIVLSGIVESIGARSNRKDIREHNKKAKQEAKSEGSASSGQ